MPLVTMVCMSGEYLHLRGGTCATVTDLVIHRFLGFMTRLVQITAKGEEERRATGLYIVQCFTSAPGSGEGLCDSTVNECSATMTWHGTPREDGVGDQIHKRQSLTPNTHTRVPIT